MDLEGIMKSEISQTKKDKYSYVEPKNDKKIKIHKINEQTKHKQIHRYREQISRHQRGRGLGSE